MLKVMFDTSVVSYWHSAHKDWREPIAAALTELQKRRENIIPLVSAITVQELACFAETLGHEELKNLRNFLALQFGKPLMVNELVALRAAHLQATIGTPPRIKPKSEHKSQVHWWFRDATIMASAIEHEVNAFVFADSNFLQWKADFHGELIRIESTAGDGDKAGSTPVPPASGE